MKYEEMIQKLEKRAYDQGDGLEFFEDLVVLNNLKMSDPIVHKMYSLAWKNGHEYGYYEVFHHFNDLVKVFKD